MTDYYLGFDDTDSKRGGCTTYVAALLCEKLKIIGSPKLIRLNPNIPYKTRGNGAVAVEVKGSKKTKETVLATINKEARLLGVNTNPGVVFLDAKKNLNKKNKKLLINFYKKTVSELVTIKEAEVLAKEIGADYWKIKSGRGIIGALASIGASLLLKNKRTDRTYELLAYRLPKNYGLEKKITKKSIFEMNEKTFPKTFNNIDSKTKKILIIPRGADPVFCGIRGETKKTLRNAWNILKPKEPIERVQIFETNQGTDAHLRKKNLISEIKQYDCVTLKGVVSTEPKGIKRGHLLFTISDKSGDTITCGAYEPTGKFFRNIIRNLIPGDEVEVYGGIGDKYKNTINLEKIKILKLKKQYKRLVPKCCGRNMKSAGKDKGYKCRKCTKRVRTIKTQLIKRAIEPGLFLVAEKAMRHLSKPIHR